MTAFDSPLFISKAACLYARPADLKQSSTSVSEKQLLCLLERRRRKYLARKESIKLVRHHESSNNGENDESPCCNHGEISMHTPRPSSSQLRYMNAQYVASPPTEVLLRQKIKARGKISKDVDFTRSSPSTVTPSSSQTDGSRETSLLDKYGCSELAEHVVRRAKVRLKRRQKRNLPSLTKASSEKQSVHKSNAASLSPAKAAVNERTKYVSAISPNNELRSSRLQPVVGGLQRSPYSKRMEIAKPTAVRNLGRQMELAESVNGVSCSPRNLKVVYWSDRQSVTPKDTGVPNVPPVTPSTSYSQSFKFIPSLSDVKSQRLLKARLQDIATKLKSDILNDEVRIKEEEKRKQKEAVVKLKAQQRSEIYALNKIMAEFEEQKFQAFISGKV